MSIGKRIKKLRGEKSLADFGADLGVSGQQISKIEHGNSSPSLELATKICELYQVSMDWLIRGIEAEPISMSMEPSSKYVTITKDELIALQRAALEKKDVALSKTIEEKKQAEQQVARLKNG